MTLLRPFEGLLRPPIEWYSSLSCSGGIILLFHFFPPSFLYTILMMIISILGLIRFKQGYRIFRYKNNLKKIPIYKMNSKELPVNKKKLFLGKGFLWTTIHTQRLRDLDLSYNLHYAKSKDFDVGGKPCIHGVGDNKDNDIYLNLIERAGHVSVIGTTGVGKTRFAELLISQDIHRGDVVIVLDPKGDKELLNRIKTEAKNADRESDVMVLHLGFPKESCRYNPIGHFTKVTQVATRITNALPSSGESAAFKEFAWKYVNLVTRALVEMNIKPTYQIIQFYITRLDDLLQHYCETVMKKVDKDYENTIESIIALNTKVNKKTGDIKKPTRRQAIFMYANQYAENLSQNREIKPDLLSDLVHASYMDKTYYTKITASLSPLLEKLCTGDIAELLSPNENDTNDTRPILDWLSVIKDKKIVYVGMDAMTDQVVSSTVGNAMLSDLVSVAGYLYNFGLDAQHKTPPRICLHADEFNEIIGDEFIPLLNKARGVGFNVVTYTQTWSDVEARLSSTAKAGQVAGNLNVVIMLRTKEAKTVDMLLNQLPTVPILRVVPASSSSDSAQGEDGKYYSSTNEDRFAHADMKLIDQNDILSLPKGHAFCLLEGGKLYKLRAPLLI